MDIKIDTSGVLKSKVILDSSVLVAYFNKLDSQHQAALKLEKQILAVSAVPDFIVLEVASILKIRASKDIALQFIDYYTNIEGTEVVSHFDLFPKFCEEFTKQINSDLSFVDSSLLALHKTGKYKIITFDKHLQKLLK